MTQKIVGIPRVSFLEDTQPESMPKIPPQNWFREKQWPPCQNSRYSSPNYCQCAANKINPFILETAANTTSTVAEVT